MFIINTVQFGKLTPQRPAVKSLRKDDVDVITRRGNDRTDGITLLSTPDYSVCALGAFVYMPRNILNTSFEFDVIPRGTSSAYTVTNHTVT